MLTNDFPCDICNLLEMFVGSFQCPPQQPRRLAIPSHLRHINTFLKSYCNILHTSPWNGRSQRKVIMTQLYTNLIVRVSVSPSNTRRKTRSKDYLFIVQCCKWRQRELHWWDRWVWNLHCSVWSTAMACLFHLNNTEVSNTADHLPWELPGPGTGLNICGILNGLNANLFQF